MNERRFYSSWFLIFPVNETIVCSALCYIEFDRALKKMDTLGRKKHYTEYILPARRGAAQPTASKPKLDAGRWTKAQG